MELLRTMCGRPTTGLIGALKRPPRLSAADGNPRALSSMARCGSLRGRIVSVIRPMFGRARTGSPGPWRLRPRVFPQEGILVIRHLGGRFGWFRENTFVSLFGATTRTFGHPQTA